MRLPTSAHASRTWRIHEFTADFRIEDVWSLPTPGGPDDFPRLVALMAASDPEQSASRASSAMWALRWKLGGLLGLDDEDDSLDARVQSLRERLPAELRRNPGPEFAHLPFRSLYQLENEWAAEIANRTVHAVMHVGWVPDGEGYRGQMTALVKPNGLLGTGYMAVIKPFREFIVYPAMMRRISRGWQPAAGRSTSTST